MSGVRNLRAMFEQKGDNLSNTPDRGRSPAPGGFASPSPSASPRPLSKVRTNFVAIEKDGRIGLKREPSGDSVSVTSRRLSNDTEATTPQPFSERTDIFSDKMASNTPSLKSNLAHEAIPESPRQDPPAKFSPKKEFKSPNLEPNANPDKITDEEEPQTKMLPGNPTDSSAARLGGTVLNGGIGDALNGRPSTTPTAKAPSSTTSSVKSTSKTMAPVSTAKTASRTQRSPLMAKPPSAKEPTKPASSAASSSANPRKATTTTTTTTTTKTTSSRPPPIELSSGTGFVKPKPKSPTRPLKLPPSLTTHTTASAQKFGSTSTAPASKQSISRGSGNAQHLPANQATHRPASRNSISTIATTTTLRRKPSNANIGRSRPSLGVPPKSTAKEVPAAKKEGHVDESFLARMMRPTQSSAHKTADKAPITPPRKQNAPLKKPDPKEVEKNGKKVATKIQASSTKAKTAKENIQPVVAKEKPTAKEIAPAVAQAETAEADSEEAKLSTDTAEATLVEEPKAKVEPSPKDIASVVAQVETAEDIIETAKASADTGPILNTPATEQSDSTPVAGPTPSLIVENGSDRPGNDLAEDSDDKPTAGPTASLGVEVSGFKEEAEPHVSVPVISENPLKVDDIEDVVQEDEESIPQAESTELTSDVAQLEDASEVNVPVVVPEVLEGDAEEIVDESAEPAESIPKVEETLTPESKTEDSKSSDVSSEGATDDLASEATRGDAVAAAL